MSSSGVGNLELVQLLKGPIKDAGSCCPSIQGHKGAIPVSGKMARGQLWRAFWRALLSYSILSFIGHSYAGMWRRQCQGTGEPGGLPSLGSHSWTQLKRLSSSSMLGWPTLPAKESGISSILTGHIVASNITKVLWGSKKERPQPICSTILGIVERTPWEMSNSWPNAWHVTIISNWNSFQCLLWGGYPSNVASGDSGSSLMTSSNFCSSESDSCLMTQAISAPRQSFLTSLVLKGTTCSFENL